jgi:hypothetical protein
MWKNVVEPDDNIIRHMCIAYCISKATDTQSEYVMGPRIPFSLEQRKSASKLRFCFASLVTHEFHWTKNELGSS